MNILSLRLDLDAVQHSPSVATKQDLFAFAAELASRCYQLDAQEVLERLEQREKLGSTGFGRGIAIPHAKLPAIQQCVGFFFRLENAIDFAAHDGNPVDLVFMMLSPDSSGAEHLQNLAGISRFLREDNIVAKLRGATGRDALYALLTGYREKWAA